MNQIHFDVMWADGTRDSTRVCAECGSSTCKYPVHMERYKIVNSKKAKEWDAQAFNDEEIL